MRGKNIRKVLSVVLATSFFSSSVIPENLKNARREAYAMIAARRKTYWMTIQAVSAEIPSVTGGLEVMVETRTVVRERKRVTSRDMRPGITCRAEAMLK